MQAVIARLMLALNGYLALVVTLRSLVDASSVAAWRAEDAIWGPHALPFNAAGSLAFAFACLYGALSPATFSPGVRWRIAAFFALDLLVQASTGKSGLVLTFWLVAAFYAACRDVDEERQGAPPLSSNALKDV